MEQVEQNTFKPSAFDAAVNHQNAINREVVRCEVVRCEVARRKSSSRQATSRQKASRKQCGQPCEEATWRDCLDQAATCCREARSAAQKGRFTAAGGLLLTSEALYDRAQTLCGGEIEAGARRSYVEAALDTYSEVARLQDAASPR